MTTNVNAQTTSIIAKDILIAALTSPIRQIYLDTDSVKASQQISAAFEVIYKKVKEVAG